MLNLRVSTLIIIYIFLIALNYFPENAYSNPIIISFPKNHTNDLKDTKINFGNFSHHEISDFSEFDNHTIILRSDLNDNGFSSTTVWISVESWSKYLAFTQETCRKKEEKLPNFNEENIFRSPYFKWENNIFHGKLRTILHPSSEWTSEPLIENGLIKQMDPAFFEIPLKSFCPKLPTINVEAEVKKVLEKTVFDSRVVKYVFDLYYLQNRTIVI